MLVGDLIYTAMAFRLARSTGRTDVTAMPLGLDTPSTFGTVFLIIGPAYQEAIGSAAWIPNTAAHHAWFLGITMLLGVGNLQDCMCAIFWIGFGGAFRGRDCWDRWRRLRWC